MADKETSNGKSNEILIDPSEFDPTRVVIHDPVTNNFKIGGADISMTVSKAYYLDDDGNECNLYFTAPSQMCFGPQYQHEMNVKDEDKGPHNAKGVQVQYPMTSLQSITQPTPDEQALIDMVQGLWDLSLEKGKEEMAKVPEQEEGGEEVNPEDYTSIPPVSYSSFLAASASKRWTNALKPVFEHPRDQKVGNKKGGADTTKPKRMFVKLKTTGRGEKMRVDTPFYGPGDIKESPLKYINVRGTITPCFGWEGIYWGGHGQQPHGASLRLFIAEANYVPADAGGSGLPKTRMLPKNTAARVERTELEEDQSEEGTFSAPASSSLASVAKANAASKTVPKGKATGLAPKAKVVAPKGKAATPPKGKATSSVAVPKGKASSIPAEPKAKVVAPKGKASAIPAEPKAKAVAPKGKVNAAPKAKVVKPAPPPPEPEEEVVEDGEYEVEGGEEEANGEEAEVNEEGWDE